MVQATYLSAIEEAERELDRLKKEHAGLLRQIEALQSFIRSGLALTGHHPTPLIGPGSIGAMLPASAALAGGGAIADQVAEILKAAGKPLHVKEIVRHLRALRDFNGKNPAASVLVAIKRRRGMFKKVGPNTFDLAERRAV